MGLISISKPFNFLGALKQKAASTHLFLLMLGTVSKLALDLSEQSQTYGVIQSMMYDGANPFSALKTISSALKSVLTETGSRHNATGLM